MKLKNRFILFGAIIVVIPVVITMIASGIYFFSSIYLFNKDIGYSNVKKFILLKHEFLQAGSHTTKILKTLENQLLQEDFLEYISKRLSDYEGIVILLKDKKVVFNNQPLSRIDIEKALEVWERTLDSRIIDIEGALYWIDVYFFESHDKSLNSLILLAPHGETYKFLRNLMIFTIIVFLISFFVTVIYVSFVFSNSILNPIDRLKRVVHEIINGNLDCEIIEEGDMEIYELSKNFEKMRLKLKESITILFKYDENRKILLSSISHDLKTPITSIKGYVEGIQDGVANTPKKLDKYLNTIYSKAVQMDKMIDDLLYYSKLDLNETTFNFERTRLFDYMRDFVEESKYDFERYNIDIIFNANMKQEITIQIDRDRFKWVLNNLLDNSRKYMGKESCTITVAIRESRTSVIIEIKDDGQGIPENKLPHIFERFYRADSSRSEQEGSGLGLSIAKMIVEGHGGRIWAISKENFGTSILISLKKFSQSS